ncbi:hypothetical protein SAMN02745664_12611 [Moraxella cuniculi DSM 21768]|uniref:Uncharacterized protein n=2 Tax=Moraxella cuniculi TaxID=34061 RepID=A0A1N7G967_9GAMM|nr:hypothetical protein B0189_11035 [Moraxella cuniculi]SIS09121.1 hypothetical protein SAMN02745664_12611 [Moraxella cuniculi DSM 21768]
MDVFNRQLHPDEIKLILDENTVEEFRKKYNLSKEEAEMELVRVAAAYKGKDWSDIYNLESYDTDGEYKSGAPAPRALTYIWSKMNDKERKAFNANSDEYYNPKINLRQLFDEIEDVKIQRAIEILYVPANPQVAHGDFVLGGQLGANQANAEASIKKDFLNLIPNPKLIFQYAKGSLTSNEVGLYDDKVMQTYYENLLRIQGKYKDLGYIQGKDWNETQKQIGASGVLLPVGGAASSVVRTIKIVDKPVNSPGKFDTIDQNGTQGYSTASTESIKNTETYFRVEGGGSGNKTSQNRITVNGDGTIKINTGCSGQLCVSTLGSDHAKYYLSEKRPNGQVVVFEVDSDLHNFIMQEAVPQNPNLRRSNSDPNAPKITDINTPGTSIELPKIWNSLLEEYSSRTRILSEREFLKEFGERVND